MNTTDNNDGSKVDKFFNEHFSSMPEFKESENRDKMMLNTILGIAEKKRAEKHSKKGKIVIFDSIKGFFASFSFSSPQFAIPIALVLIVCVYSVFFFNKPTEPQVATNQTNQHEYQIKSRDLALNDVKPKEKGKEEVITSKDFGTVSYDLSDRGDSKQTDDQHLNKLVVSVIDDVFRQNNIVFINKNNTIETEWLLENDKLVRLVCSLNTQTKDIKLKLQQKQIEPSISYKTVNMKALKIQLEDSVFTKIKF